MSSESVTIYFDYLCPFSWRVAELLDMVAEPLDLRCDWKHFSLYQSNYDSSDERRRNNRSNNQRSGSDSQASDSQGNDSQGNDSQGTSNQAKGKWQLWNDKLDINSQNGSKGLLPFLASHAAKRQGEQTFQAFRLALLRACHRDHHPFDKDTIWRIAEQVDLHLPTFASDLNDPECRTTLAHEHMEAAALDIFGTPTLRFKQDHDSDHIAYLRIRDVPLNLEEAVALFQTYHQLLFHYPYLETIRRPRPRNN
jgi:predicted DsbA family dithiol-disulfide isomerase